MTPNDKHCKTCNRKLPPPAKPAMRKIKTLGVACPIGIFGKQPCTICGRLTEYELIFKDGALPSAFLCSRDCEDKYRTVPDIKEPLSQAYPHLYGRPEIWHYFEKALRDINNIRIQLNRLHTSNQAWSKTYKTGYRQHAATLEKHREWLQQEFRNYKQSIGHGVPQS